MRASYDLPPTWIVSAGAQQDTERMFVTTASGRRPISAPERARGPDSPAL